MENFEYASPKTVKEATALLGSSWADAQVLAGRDRPDQPDEGLRRPPPSGSSTSRTSKNSAGISASRRDGHRRAGHV